MVIVSSVSVIVGVIVSGDKSGVVGVRVFVSVRPLAVNGVIVVVSVVEGVTIFVGDGVCELEGKGVGVRHVPGVARLRYCGHSSSCIKISRSPPGNDSQICLVCRLLWDWDGGGNAKGDGSEIEAVNDACGDDVAVDVFDGEEVTVICGVTGSTVVEMGDGVVAAVKVDVKDGTGRGDEVDVGLEIKAVGVA